MRRIHWRYLIPLGALLAAALLIYFALLADLPDPGRGLSNVAAPSILITDRNGRPLYEVIDPNGNKYVPLALSEIPPACQQATIATEDSRFYQHPGVDLLAILRTAWQNRSNLGATPGASTLTQQLARNLYLSEDERVERSLRRKLREAWLAWRLEQTHSKNELLTLYLNTTYYGHFAVGIEAAAQAYFGSHARDLDLAQCALIAGLPQYPAGYNPIENAQAARYRQKVVLGLMVKDGVLSAAQADDAYGERLAYASTPFPIEAPHFVMWVQSQLEEMLGPERVQAGGLRVTTTLDLDWQHRAEEIVARRLAQLKPCAAGAEPPICDPKADPARRVDNAALVALDPQTGAVLAMVGSPDYFDATINGAVNASLSLRQPGSAIKPLTYAAALDPARAARAGQQPWTAATMIADLRTVFPTAEGAPYVPLNYDLTFHGPVTVRTALANSYNIPAVKTLQFIGVDALVEQAARLGIPWDDEAGSWKLEAGNLGLAGNQPLASSFQSPVSRFGLALTLGGGEVRLLDLTAAYATFANGGQRVTPFGIERIETLDGQPIADCRPVLSVAEGLQIADCDGQTLEPQKNGIAEAESRNTQHAARNTQYAIDTRVAYLISDILSDSVARIPSFGEQSALEIGRPAAAKTGTTTDWRDNWTVGYTPDLATGVWVGNADNTPMQDISGITGAGPIWHDFMTTALRNTPPNEFTRPEGLVRVDVCADSGLLPDCRLPIADCRSANLQSQIANRKSQIANLQSIIPCPHRRYEWFIAGTEPTQVDDMHRQVNMDVRTGELADVTTPAEFVAAETVWALPEEYRAWARENGIPQPAQGSKGAGEQGNAPQPPRSPAPLLAVTSPDPNRVYRLDPALPPDAQKLPVTAQLRSDLAAAGAPVTLLLDGAAFAQVHGPEYTAWWPLSRGRHVWQAVVIGTDGEQVRSEQVVVFVE
ncbi:MAG: transglycosylase domain-containing protein [Chloroflexi bacterium]|nr:transglycosylase domain-containing protein [Chloroflexota bacterium]